MLALQREMLYPEKALLPGAITRNTLRMARNQLHHVALRCAALSFLPLLAKSIPERAARVCLIVNAVSAIPGIIGYTTTGSSLHVLVIS